MFVRATRRVQFEDVPYQHKGILLTAQENDSGHARGAGVGTESRLVGEPILVPIFLPAESVGTRPLPATEVASTSQAVTG
jgi:hypothetical protein